MKRWIVVLLILVLCACETAAPVVQETTPVPTVTSEPEIEIVDVVIPGGLSSPAEVYTPIPTDTPEPTAEPTDAPTPTPSGLLGGRFPDKFSDEPVKTERSYKSKSVSVELTTYETEGVYHKKKVVYHVADIYVQDVTSIKTAPAKTFEGNYTDLPDTIARGVGALVAIDGDTFARTKKGFIIRNGTLYRKRRIDEKDLCVLYRDGTMETYRYNKYNIDKIIEADPWQVWNFGPELLDEDGKAIQTFNNETYRMKYEHPRTVLGYYEPGHYCFVVVDGRQPGYSEGVTLQNLAKLMQDLGCKRAYNMDGGGSAIMYWDGGVASKVSSGTRTISDIIYILPEE